jgi:putative glycosyltransferase (TIGR04372 family)
MSPPIPLRALQEQIRRNRLVHRSIAFALFVVESMLSLPLCLARVRILRLTAIGRIGHLAAEPDFFIKDRLLGSRGWYYGVIVSPPGTAANDCLLDYWRRYLRVVRSPFWSWILNRLSRFSCLRYDVSQYTVAINQTAPYVALQKAWGDRAPLLTLSDAHRREGWDCLAELGIPADAKIVCFHCREGSYSPSDEDLHSFRNCSIENYLPAVAAIASRGYWCIRMGDPTMRRFEPMERVIDYAHLDIRSDRMDVFLSASCTFLLASPSGVAQLTGTFGRPCATANQVPLSSVLQFGIHDVAIPKLLWSEKEQRYVGFREAFESDASNFRFTRLYRENGVWPVENTAEEVRDLALEMLERSEGRAVYTPEDERLQRRFQALMRPGHYGYGGINRVGRNFLRKYALLLEDGPAKLP